MELSDLFVNYKAVDPVVFNLDTPELPKTLYLNFERAQKAASGDDEDFDVNGDDTSDWVVGKDILDWRVNNAYKNEEEITIPYREGVKPDSKPEKKSNTSNKTVSTTLQQYRNSQDYQNFKQQLDTFINNNAQYASIKDSLDYLAALESRYQMGVENYQGSKALGWFQFMDKTRKPYNNQTRQQFANDAQAQLLTAAKYYTDLQNRVRQWGGDPNDFVTMYGAWWRPESARQYIQNGNHNHRTVYNEDFLTIRQRAQDLLA